MQNKRPPGTWTEEQKALIRTLVESGFSRGEIAAELTTLYGYTVTRNSIAGLCHRSNIPAPPGATRPAPPPQPRKLWTASEKDRLTILFRSGATHREIANSLTTEFARTITTGSVRRQLSRISNSPSVTLTQTRNSPDTTSPHHQARHLENTSRKWTQLPPNETKNTNKTKNTTYINPNTNDQSSDPFPENIPLLALKRRSCRWIVSRTPQPASQLFCGKECISGHSWCTQHASLAYTPDHARNVHASSNRKRIADYPDNAGIQSRRSKNGQNNPDIMKGAHSA